jgi:circadian clock protein KaiC
MAPTDPQPSSTLATGIPGLDTILAGGLPGRRMYLVQGDPGAGKTTLALQFLLEGVRRGERALYISLSETREELDSIAAAHGWSFEGLSIVETAGAEAAEDVETTLYQPSEVELGERMRAILDEIDRLRPARIVLDSCSELRLLAQSGLRYRRQVLAMKRRLALLGCTILLIDNPVPGAPDVLLQSLVHGVITLEQLAPLYGRERRRIRIVKLRGLRYRGGYHDLVIRTGGLVVFPRLVAADDPGAVARGKVSSGLASLDALLGGGPPRGSCLALIGPSGSGKSSVASRYALAAAERGERVAVYAFDESRAMLLARAASLGMDLRPHVERGTVAIQQVDPAELSPGEFTHLVREATDAGAGVVVIDSLNGFLTAMPEERFVLLQLHELLSFLAHRGVLTLVTVTQHGLVGTDAGAPLDMSYLADAVLFFRYFEAGGRVRKALSAVKNRAGPHESTIRELSSGAGGLVVGPVLGEFRGILTGVPEPLAAPRGPADAGGEG